MSEKLTAPAPERIKAMEPEELLKQYDRLIRKIANRYANTAARYAWIDDADLRQVASIAMLKAQATYEPKEEASFMHYACVIMQREILRALNVRWTPYGYISEPAPVSLDEPINEDGETTRGELIPGTDPPLEELAEKADLADRIRAAVHSLPDDQTEVIERLYLNEPTETQKQIAEEKGVSDQTICGRQKRAIRKLRIKLRNLEPELPYHIGLSKFRTRWISEPEQYVINRETQFEEWNNGIKKFIKERKTNNEKPTE